MPTPLPQCPYNLHIWDFKTILNVVVIPMLLVSGILGNSLVFYLLIRIRRYTLNFYNLKFIAFLNAVTCWVGLIRNSYSFLLVHSRQQGMKFKWLAIFRAHYAFIIITGLSKASIWCLCVILFERFVAVMYPHQYKSFTNIRVFKYLPYIIIIACISLCYSSYYWYELSECFVYKMAPMFNFSLSEQFATNSVVLFSSNKSILPILSHYNDNEVFYRYIEYRTKAGRWTVSYNYFREILLSIIPGLLILYFGCSITHALFKLYSRKRRINPNEIFNILALKLKESTADLRHCFLRNISPLLYFLLYFICYLPNFLVMVFQEQIEEIQSKPNPSWFFVNCIDIANILVIMFFSTNIYIYIGFDRNIKQSLKSCYIFRKIFFRHKISTHQVSITGLDE
ncbi:unnamed protein product [Gordionus sp. m RMFG-2023]